MRRLSCDPQVSGFGVDSPPARSLYNSHTARRPPLGAMSRLRSTSLIFGDQAFDRDRKRDASTALRPAGEGTVSVPGCLTSESEERETWTAESLRAALLRRSTLRKTFKGKRPEETSAVLRFRSYTVFVQAAGGLQVQNLKRARARMKKVTDLVKRCDQPGKVLIQT
jgi:hypothetical protein